MTIGQAVLGKKIVEVDNIIMNFDLLVAIMTQFKNKWHQSNRVTEISDLIHSMITFDQKSCVPSFDLVWETSVLIPGSSF